jgi:glycosyltransferase involved in cell wall biosynthesis
MDWYLPGTKAGGPVRSIFSLIELLKADFDFFILTTNTDLGSDTPYDGIPTEKFLFRDQVQYFYFERKTLKQAVIRKTLAEIGPDLIYVNSFWSWPFSINLVRRIQSYGNPPVLLAPRGMLGKGALGIKSLKKRAFLNIAKASGWYRNVIFHATQEQERSDILKELPGADIFLAPNVNAGIPRKNLSFKIKGELRLFFLSRISPVKNLRQALEILAALPPGIRVVYDIFGNMEDKAYWEECQRSATRMRPDVSFTYRGELPFDKVQETIASYHALLLPTLNENYGHAIVESLLSGCPVIISDQTPWTDVHPADAGYALSLSNNNAFVNAIVEMAELDQSEFERRSASAINYISRKIDLPRIMAQYKTMFNECSRH